MNNDRHGKTVNSAGLKKIFYLASTSPGTTYHATVIEPAIV